mmetsp:Transcript_41470/g.102308  ORF Transcript_41470/g.102308 Transcript_41470/m.102308 type:complete len:217 (+) Transcript_41470:3110-3760(+)
MRLRAHGRPPSPRAWRSLHSYSTNPRPRVPLSVATPAASGSSARSSSSDCSGWPRRSASLLRTSARSFALRASSAASASSTTGAAWCTPTAAAQPSSTAGGRHQHRRTRPLAKGAALPRSRAFEGPTAAPTSQRTTTSQLSHAIRSRLAQRRRVDHSVAGAAWRQATGRARTRVQALLSLSAPARASRPRQRAREPLDASGPPYRPVAGTCSQRAV